MKKKMLINTKLNMINYIVMVNEMAREYFNEDGEYQPHIGMLNVMRLFYNNCVVESKFDKTHNITDAMDMVDIVEDEDFLDAFDGALCTSAHYRLNFANAYCDAIDIVETKKKSAGTIVNSVKKMATSIIDTINPILSEDNVNKVAEIAKNVANGKLSADDIVNAYRKSDRFQDVVNSDTIDIDTAVKDLVTALKKYHGENDGIKSLGNTASIR